MSVFFSNKETIRPLPFFLIDIAAPDVKFQKLDKEHCEVNLSIYCNLKLPFPVYVLNLFCKFLYTSIKFHLPLVYITAPNVVKPQEHDESE